MINRTSEGFYTSYHGSLLLCFGLFTFGWVWENT